MILRAMSLLLTFRLIFKDLTGIRTEHAKQLTTVKPTKLILALIVISAVQPIAIKSNRPISIAKSKQTDIVQTIRLNGNAGGKRFDGIGIVNGGGATSVLLKDYPEPQRSQILDLVFKPKFGASVSALFIEIPGDGNSTQGSMPSHMRTRDDLNYYRGYTWWFLLEAKKRNPSLSLDGTAWSAPGWIGNGEFWSQDAADYYVKWVEGLRNVYGLEFDAIGCRNEKGANFDFVKRLRATLNAHGFEKIKIHAFDNWPNNKFDFVKEMLTDEKLGDSIDIISGHILGTDAPASADVQEMAARMYKPIWNTEEHVYKKGFDCAISIVEAFNESFIRSGATKIVNWYDIAGVYPVEPYSEDPAMILARSPWSGNYEIREALWGYAHYGQFTEVGWQYINGGQGELAGGGSFVSLKSPSDDYSIIIETKEAKASQQIQFMIDGGLSTKGLSVWRSNAREQFIRQTDIKSVNGNLTLSVDSNSIYTLTTTTGQRKGGFANVPVAKPFPFPYRESFDQYSAPKVRGYLPKYTADIAEVFEIVGCPNRKGKCLRQVIPVAPISWAPEWMPYTILGDEGWPDYEVSADVYLDQAEAAAVMGRINHVGTGYGSVPKGYFLELGHDGECRLVVIRGPMDKDNPEGGEKVLGSARIPGIHAKEWHKLKLRFNGSTITGFVDGKTVLRATDTLYSRGMVGLMTGGGKKLSMSYFDNLLIR
jgi:galactosylceramidase